MPRRTYTFPKYIIEAIEEEAKRRLIEMNQVGTKLLGSMSRDIICICIKHALKQVQQMTIQEFMNEANRATRRKKSPTGFPNTRTKK